MSKATRMQGIFGAPDATAKTKAQMTDSVVQSIISAETSSRDAKTARLRAARLEKEAAEREEQAAKPAAAASPRKKPARKS